MVSDFFFLSFLFSGDFTLDINPVLLEDDAVFQCQVGAAEGVAPIRSKDATLTVTVPPEPPVILNGDQYRTTEDRPIEIECISRGGKPAAEVRNREEPLTEQLHSRIFQ